MITPVRLQLSRRKGFNLQAHSMAVNGLEAVNVARPSIFGNIKSCSRPFGCPHHHGFVRAEWENDKGEVHPFRCCVDAFRHYVETGLTGEDTRLHTLSAGMEAMQGYPRRTELVRRLPELRGRNLACWCKPDDLCHADVLLEIANR